ncbi:hypothetical protein [Pseudoclavibacter terrae]|uniref:LPXTG cell wall anchor domain-containing protein n=1 Tax=Pseudoclavibacter terrae TaxID=1530195 RepID=A0A7J5AYF5_9MICO|nr:hypothetical protein [Pseudoclavibacter terrae]KAB1636091.1 hypothetical protein F8O03_17710 [Pseudoclavibacter terrae]
MTDGILAADGPKYRALVLRDQETLSRWRPPLSYLDVPERSPMTTQPGATTVPVVDPESTGGPVAEPGVSTPGDDLAITGSSVAWGATLAALLAVATGVILYQAGKRRRTS